MNDRELDFEELKQELRNGSQDAAWQLIRNHASQILRVVRRRLPNDLRSKFDSQDFLQAVWASVFAHPSRLQRCDEPSQFVAYLGAIAANKVKTEVRRRLYGQKHNVRREQPLNPSPDGSQFELTGSDATPSECAIARERWGELMDGQPEHYKKMVELRLTGMSIREIAKELDMHEGTVQRAMQRLFQQHCV